MTTQLYIKEALVTSQSDYYNIMIYYLCNDFIYKGALVKNLLIIKLKLTNNKYYILDIDFLSILVFVI